MEKKLKEENKVKEIEEEELDIDTGKSKISGIHENSDEEFSLDFSKVKNIFKKKKEMVKEGKKELVEDEEKDDEEFSLDFSKVKNIFKKKDKPKDDIKKEEKIEVKEETKSEDEEVSFDLSKAKDKIKGVFKGLKGGKKEKESDGEEISFDTKKIAGFFNKNKKYLVPLLIIIIAMSFSIHFRLYPLNLPVTDNWARSNIVNFNREVVTAQVNQVYPNLPDANRKKIIDDELNNLLDSGNVFAPGPEGLQQVSYKDALKGYSESFKSRLQDDSGQTYLLAIDPYFWMRHADNVLKNGHPGDAVKDGRQWDTFMLAPGGRPLPKDDMLHAYFEAYLYKFLHFFNRSLELKNIIFYVPVLLSALAIIPAFFIGRRLGGNFGGLVTGILVAIHPSFLGRTAGGFADTDAYNVLLPLLITWLFLESFEAKDNLKRFGLVISAGFFCGVYSFAWLGWWYIFDVLMAAIGVYILYYIVTHRSELKGNLINFIKQPAIKNTLMLAILFFISSLFFVTVFTNFGRFNMVFSGPSSIVALHEVGITTIWPNVFTTVAEQNEVSIKEAIDLISMGQRFLFFIAVLGIILALLKKDRHGKVDVKYAAILIIWFVGALFGSTRGIRFVLLLVPAFSIAVGVGVGIVYQYITKWMTKEIGVNKYVSKIALFIVLSLLLINPIKSAESTAMNELPSMDDAWYNSLKRIDNAAAPDAIINSWWDFGHWFKMIGNRAVTFDGTSQNSPQAHWIGKTLLTDDEDEAIGILRMLDCSGADHKVLAFNELDNIIKDGAKTVDILYEVVVLGKVEAKSKLKEHGITNEEADMILDLTHCDPPENYFITSEDMIGKSGVWAHFGSWNFDRALIYNTLKKKEYGSLDKAVEFLQERFDYTKEKAENIYYEVQSITDSKEANSWIAPWPSYSSGVDSCSKLSNDSISCSISNVQVKINLTTMEAEVNTQQGVMHPNSLVYPTEDSVLRKSYDNNIGVSMVLIPQENGYKRLLTAPELDGSMFTRLFYMEGHGLKHFEKFSDETGIYGERIIIWKVDWDGKQDNKLDVFKESEPVEEEIVSDEVQVEIEDVEEDISEEELENILEEVVSESTDENV